MLHVAKLPRVSLAWLDCFFSAWRLSIRDGKRLLHKSTYKTHMFHTDAQLAGCVVGRQLHNRVSGNSTGCPDAQLASDF